jgi:single-stranded-DNA-specific exonuclease
MYGEHSEICQSTLINCLDYVAIGTVADVVPLIGENRYMVEAGLNHMMQSRLPFLKDYWNRKILRTDLGEHYGPEHVGYYMAPRLNAASRLDSAWPAFHFLTSVKLESVVEYGNNLENYNQLRVQRLKQLKSSMEMKVHKFENIPLIVIESNSRELGLMGLLASSFSDLYARAVIALATNPSGELVGSARGILGFNLKSLLDSVSQTLLNHGGHARAAGLRLKSENLPEFIKALTNLEPVGYEQEIAPKTFCTYLDGANLSENFVDQQRGLGPFGEENARPVFALKNYRLIRQRKVGSEQKDLSLEIECHSGTRLSVIGFGLGAYNQEFMAAPPLVGQLEYYYFGTKRVQLQCQGIASQ